MKKLNGTRMLTLFLALVLSLTSLAGCKPVTPGVSGSPVTPSGSPSQSVKPTGEETKNAFETPYKIGIVNQSLNALALERKAYLEEYVGPAFNVQFIFSEAIENADAELAFIDNAVTAGATAIISYRSSDYIRMANYCNDKKVYYCTYSVDKETEVLPYVAGGFLGNPTEITESFKGFVKQFTADGKKHGFLITSGGASRGNAEQRDIAVACLQAIQDAYGLTYEDSLEKLAVVSEPTQVKNSAGLEILVYPGYPNDSLMAGVSSAFQSGKYDIFLTVLSFSNFAVIIDEAERSFNMDIKTGGTGQITDALVKAFATDDVFKNPSINSIVFNSETVRTGKMFAAIYNCLSGHSDVVHKDNRAVTFLVPYVVANNREEFDKVKGIDKGADSYVCTIENIKEMLAVSNPGLTFEGFRDYNP